MGKRLFLIDNGLQNQSGHHFTMDRDFSKALTARGLECRVWVHGQATRDVCQALRARPVFSYSPFDRFSTDPLAGPIRSMFVGGHRFFLDLEESCRTDPIGHDDVVFLPFVLRNELHGMAIWLARLPKHERPRVLMNIGYDDSLQGGSGTPDPLKLAAYRLLGFRLTDSFEETDLVLTTCGQRNAGFFSETLGYPVRDYPLAHSYDGRLPRPGQDDRRNGSVLVSIFGHSQKRKGFHLLPEIFRRAVAGNPDLKFFIQVDPPEAVEYWEEADDLLSSDRVEVRFGSLDSEEYFDRLEASDILLMPYAPSYYEGCTSGIFTEGVAFGKVCVVARGTWAQEQLEAGHGAGAAIGAFTAEAAARVLLTVADRIGPLRRQAEARIEPWRALHSTEGFVARMLDDLGLRSADWRGS